MAYLNIEGSERQAVITRLGVIAAEIPPPGLLKKDGAKSYLFFKHTDGFVQVVDVTGSEPPHFEQTMPAPSGFWNSVYNNLSGLGQLAGGVDHFSLTPSFVLIGIGIAIGIFVLILFLKAVRK